METTGVSFKEKIVETWDLWIWWGEVTRFYILISRMIVNLKK